MKAYHEEGATDPQPVSCTWLTLSTIHLLYTHVLSRMLVSCVFHGLFLDNISKRNLRGGLPNALILKAEQPSFRCASG